MALKSYAGIGFGVVFPDFNYCGALPTNASGFTSDFYGILTALKRIDHENCSYSVFIDSKGVLEALGSFNPVHLFILEILEWIFLLSCKQKVVCFCWVAAHVGIVGNE